MVQWFEHHRHRGHGVLYGREERERKLDNEFKRLRKGDSNNEARWGVRVHGDGSSSQEEGTNKRTNEQKREREGKARLGGEGLLTAREREREREREERGTRSKELRRGMAGHTTEPNRVTELESTDYESNENNK